MKFRIDSDCIQPEVPISLTRDGNGNVCLCALGTPIVKVMTIGTIRIIEHSESSAAYLERHGFRINVDYTICYGHDKV